MLSRLAFHVIIIVSPGLLILLGYITGIFYVAGIGAIALGSIVDPFVAVIALGTWYHFRTSRYVFLWTMIIGVAATTLIQVLLQTIDWTPLNRFRIDGVVGRLLAFMIIACAGDLVWHLRRGRRPVTPLTLK